VEKRRQKDQGGKVKDHIYKISFNLKGTREQVIKEAMEYYKHPLFYDQAVIVNGEGKKIAVVNDNEKVGIRKLKKIEKLLKEAK